MAVSCEAQNRDLVAENMQLREDFRAENEQLRQKLRIMEDRK